MVISTSLGCGRQVSSSRHGPGTQPVTLPEGKNRRKQHVKVSFKSVEAKVTGQFQGSQLILPFSTTI